MRQRIGGSFFPPNDGRVPSRCGQTWSGAGKGCLACFFLCRNFSVLVADYDHALPLPVFFYFSLLRGRAEGAYKFESSLPNHPTYLPTALHYLLILSYLPAYTYLIYRRSHVCSYSILRVILEFLASRKKGAQSPNLHHDSWPLLPCTHPREMTHEQKHLLFHSLNFEGKVVVGGRVATIAFL